MKLKTFVQTIVLLSVFTNLEAQQTTLSLAKQTEDFEIFIGGLKEGHAGLYYFIDPKTFAAKCDSVSKTFVENASIEAFYLKLRYLVTLLRHGHTGISLPSNGWVNYRMRVLDSTKLYLPFECLIVNKQLLIKEDCSKEQLFPRYSVVKSIGGVSTKLLTDRMLQYNSADGINQTFKDYNLYNYFYFHHLYNLFYPSSEAVEIELENNRTHYYIQLLKAKAIDSIYSAKNKKSISQYGKQLEYKSDMPNQTAYLRVSSFYKGLIENFGQKYEQFLDSTFADIKLRKLQNLIIDLRNNEGGGDGYDFMLLSYLINSPLVADEVTVPGRIFNFTKYSTGLSDDLKAYIENPNEFLKNDSSLVLKEKYTGQIILPTAKNFFNGKILVLTNGGTFSASTNVIKRLYSHRQGTNNKILFIGEENGGDIYSNTECAGQSYGIKLPNSALEIYMPLMCFGELKKQYPKKRLPDYPVYEKINDLLNNKDTVLEFAIKLCEEK